MKTRIIKPLFLAVLVASLGACDQEPLPKNEEIDVNPASLEEARTSIAQIEARLRAHPQDARALQAVQALRPKLDELNHLVARVEATPGHVVSFYESEPGVIGVSESGPAGEARVLTAVDSDSVVALYRRLAGGAEAPATLLAAEERENGACDGVHETQDPGQLGISDRLERPALATTPTGESIGSTQSALTSSDGQWFAANGCWVRGDAHYCFPDWWNGGWADYTTKTSFFQLAPFAGGTVWVQFQYEGSTRFIEPTFQGEWRSWWWHSSAHWDCCFICACGTKKYDNRHHRWDLVEASGKGFHWSTEARWSCSWLDCDQAL